MKDILKNNILSIICGVVVIIALVVPVWPMGGYKQELNAKLTERVGVYNSLTALKTKSRNLPAVDPENPTPTPLEGFPNENVIAKADAVKASFETQSKQLVDEAIKLNQHNLLVPGILPQPGNNAIAINFRDRYRNLLLFSTNPQGAIVKSGIANNWKVGVPPTQQDIKNATDELWRSKYQPQLGTAVPGASVAHPAKQALMAEFNAEAGLVPDQQRNQVATSSRFYMNPDCAPRHPQLRQPRAAPAAGPLERPAPPLDHRRHRPRHRRRQRRRHRRHPGRRQTLRQALDPLPPALHRHGRPDPRRRAHRRRPQGPRPRPGGPD